MRLRVGLTLEQGRQLFCYWNLPTSKSWCQITKLGNNGRRKAKIRILAWQISLQHFRTLKLALFRITQSPNRGEEERHPTPIPTRFDTKCRGTYLRGKTDCSRRVIAIRKFMDLLKSPRSMDNLYLGRPINIFMNNLWTGQQDSYFLTCMFIEHNSVSSIAMCAPFPVTHWRSDNIERAVNSS